MVASIDAQGDVTTTSYDGIGNAIATRAYATALTLSQWTALGSNPTWAALQADLSVSANDRLTQTFYDADNRAVATVDAAGYVTVTTYDAAGDAVKTTAYATALTGTQQTALRNAPALSTLQADLISTAQDQTTRSYYNSRGQVILQIDAAGYVTTILHYEIGEADLGIGKQAVSTRYTQALTPAQLAALTGAETAASVVGMVSASSNMLSRVDWDAAGRLLYSYSLGAVILTSYTYDGVGHLLTTTAQRRLGGGVPRISASAYDAFGDVVGTLDGVGAANLVSGMTAAQQTAVFSQYGTTSTYNALGQRITSTDPLGNTTYAYYDASGRLAYTVQGQPAGSTLNAVGNVTAYTYNAFGQVATSRSFSSPLTLTTSGSSSGTTLNVTTATMAQLATAAASLANPATDRSTSYTYTLNGQVASAVDGLGYQAAYQYDAFGDLLQQQQQLSAPGSALSAANSTITSDSYDLRGERIGETDALGTSVARSTSQTYDAFGRVTQATDGNGQVITYSYDTLGRKISVAQTVQGTARIANTTYDAFGSAITQTDALGNVTSYQYDYLNNKTTVTTPGGMQIITVTDVFGDTLTVTDGANNTTTYTYDADGHLTQTQDALGNLSKNQYDLDGHLTQSTDATGHVVTYSYDAGSRVLTRTVDPTGLNLKTSYVYDGQGRTLSVTDPMGSVTTTSYDADGHVLTQVQDAGTGKLNLTTTYTYDGAGKTLTLIKGAGSSAASTTQYVYDNRERLSQTIVDPAGLKLTTSYSYDANDNLLSVTDANGNVTRYVYNEANQKVFTIDPTGAVTQATYDTDGRLTLTRGYATVLTAGQLGTLGNTPTLAAITADLSPNSADSYHQSVYNADGQVLYVLDGTALNVTQYAYNSAGQRSYTRQYASPLTSAIVSATATPSVIASLLNPGSGDVQSWAAYNADGAAVYRIDGAGDVTQLTYDAAGRISKTTAYATPLTSAQLTALGTAPTTAQVATPIAASANDRSSFAVYDNAGRTVYAVDAAGAVVQSTYDADGRVTSTHAYATALTSAQLTGLGNNPTATQIGALVTASANDPMRYTLYDAAGEARFRIDPLGYVTETRYDATGRVAETLAYPNAVSLATQTGALQQGTALSWLSSTVGGTTGSNADSSAEATLYLYDAAGRQRFTVQQNNGGNLAQVTEQRYDANGNVAAQVVYGNTLTVSPGQSLSAQLSTAGVAGVVAGFGNSHLTSQVYDADNRAVYRIDTLGHVTQWTYDSFGRVTQTTQYANAIVLPAMVTASAIATAITTAGGSTGARTSAATYDALGHLLSSGDALGTSATYTYNGLGQKISATNRDGAVWHYSYDSAGRLAQTQSPAVTVGSYSSVNAQFQSAANQYLYTTSTYDAFGDVISTSQGYGSSAAAITNLSTSHAAYDAAGRQVQTINALNLTTSTVTYNALGQAVVSKDGNGNLSYRSYNAAGELTYAIDGNGYVQSQTYDAYGNLLTVTHYATALNTAAISGWSAGQPLTQAQVGQGLVTSASDRTTTTTYNQLNQKTQVTQPTISYVMAMGQWAGNGTTGAATATYTYDAYGNLTSTSNLIQGALTLNGTTTPVIWATTYTYYDALNRAVIVVTPTGAYTSPQGYITTTAYDAFGAVVTRTDYAQAISTSGISTAAMPTILAAPADGSRATSYTYDAIGRQASETLTGIASYTTNVGAVMGALSSGSVGGGQNSSVTNITYDGENRVTSVSVNGTTTTTTYDALGRVATVTAPARQALVSNWQALLEANPGYDLTTAALYTNVSPVTTYVYDALGNKLSTNVSAGGLSRQTWSYYDAAGELTGVYDPNGATLRSTTYDANGNVLTQSYTLTGSTTVTTTRTYDADNQLLSEVVQRSGVSTYDRYVRQQYDAFGEVVAKGDNTGYQASYGYDNNGNLTYASNSHTGARHYYSHTLMGWQASDANLITGGSVWTLDQFDLAGRAIAHQVPNTASASGQSSSISHFAYDRWGNVVSLTDAVGNTTQNYYDSRNQLYQQVEANVLVVSASGARTWATPTKEWYRNVNGQLMGSTDENTNSGWNAYDTAGNLTMSQDNTGARTYTAYDALGCAVAQQTPPVQTVNGTQANITYTSYDGLNQVIGQGYFQLNGAGTARTLIAQQTYVLDNNGDRLQVTDALGNASYYTYDGQKRVLTSQTPLQHTNSQSKTFVYDVNGYLTRQTDTNGNTQSWVYDYFGRVQSHVDLSGATYTYTYDANTGLLTTETSNWAPTGPAATTTATLNFSYEADAQLAGLTEVVNGVTSTYGYSYDANGNEILETVNTQDGNGATVANQTVITYDSHNRLQEVTVEDAAGAVATMRSVYVYDANGNRRAVYTCSNTGAGGVAAAPIPVTAGAPTAITLAAQSVAPGNALTYAVGGNFSDPLGIGLTYTASGLPSWLSFDAGSQTFSGTPPVPTAAGSNTVTVTATDVVGRSVSSTFTVTVALVAPVFSSGVSNQTVQPGAAMAAYQAPAATDANGDAVTYSASGLPAGLSFNAATRTFSGTISAIAAAAYTITYTATSSSGTTISTSFTITVPAVAPVFSGGVSNQSLTPGVAMTPYQVPAATDANGYAVSYSASGLPPGINFDAPSRTFSGTLTAAGTYTVTYTATSSAGTTASLNFAITVPAVTPVFSGGVSNQSAMASIAMSAYQAPAATDANGSQISYSASGLPAGVSFDPSSRIFSGTPTTPGSYTVTYTATSSAGPVASTTFVITVGAAPTPVYNGGIPTYIGFAAGDTTTWTMPANTFSNPMGRPLTYQLNGFFPPGTSMDASGTITSSPPIAMAKQHFIGHIFATDPVDGLSVSVAFTLVVGPYIGAMVARPMVAAAAAAPAPAPNIVANWYTYDADNRVQVANGSLQNGQIVITTATNSAANVYDAAGNVATYMTQKSAGQNTLQRNSYNVLNQLTMVQTQAPGSGTLAPYETRSYDLDGRLTSDVTYNLPGHQGAGTSNGTLVTFNDAGWVATDTFYSYNADGGLVDQSEYAETSAQALITQYGNNVAANYADTAPPSAPSGATAGSLLLVTDKNYGAAGPGYGYDAEGNALGYRVTTGSAATVVNGSPTSGTIGYQNSYIKQNSLLLASTTPTLIAGGGTLGQPTVNTYNDLGELSKIVGTVNGTSQTQVMAYSAGGQMLQQSTSTSSTVTTTYASVNEQQLGSVDTAGNINVLSTTGGYSNSNQGTQNYTVSAGDTLRSIAQAIYGNGNYAYILAQANGLSLDSTLTLGMVLRIPQVTTSTNAYDTFQPYAQGALLSGGGTAFDTTGQIVALSISALLNQQSALAQTVAQIEQASQEWARQQADAAAARSAAAAAQAAANQAEAAAAVAAQQAEAAKARIALEMADGERLGGSALERALTARRRQWIEPWKAAGLARGYVSAPSDGSMLFSFGPSSERSNNSNSNSNSNSGSNYTVPSDYSLATGGTGVGDDSSSTDSGSQGNSGGSNNNDQGSGSDAGASGGDTGSGNGGGIGWSGFDSGLGYLQQEQAAYDNQQIAQNNEQINQNDQQVAQETQTQAQDNVQYSLYQNQYQQAEQQVQQAQAQVAQLSAGLSASHNDQLASGNNQNQNTQTAPAYDLNNPLATFNSDSGYGNTAAGGARDFNFTDPNAFAQGYLPNQNLYGLPSGDNASLFSKTGANGMPYLFTPTLEAVQASSHPEHYYSDPNSRLDGGMTTDESVKMQSDGARVWQDRLTDAQQSEQINDTVRNSSNEIFLKGMAAPAALGAGAALVASALAGALAVPAVANGLASIGTAVSGVLPEGMGSGLAAAATSLGTGYAVAEFYKGVAQRDYSALLTGLTGLAGGAELMAERSVAGYKPTPWLDSASSRFESVPGEAVPFSPIVDGGGLQAHEDAGGHLLLKHVGQSEQDLLDRLAAEPNISGSSSFYDRAAAESAVSQTIDANQQAVTNWLSNGSSGRLRLDYSLSDPVGISVSRGATSAVDVNSARVILVRDSSMPTGYKILTGFPTKP
ncbi:putative Ig domain-containing protein [Dyella tabacisoli]|uniref:putative Ig domain-containing protein n=1 Tax=Dyella tabacisoli TaxID=2282381 RepID=UPI001CDC06C1|nr:putative Ig domain-containing protein [Dyella tabacisoli]